MAVTRVVSVKLDPYEVYIGGPGKGEDGYFGNFAARLHYAGQMTREQCLEVYEAYLKFRVATDPAFKTRLLALRGKVLGCFCAGKGGLTAADPLICHGQVIAAYLDSLPGAV